MDDRGAGASHEMARQQHSLGHDPESEPPPPPPPAAAISSQGIIAQDITEKFSTAVKALAPGELVKDGFFSLFEAVSALEIMDPKMDSGCVKPGEEFDELYDVSRQLSPEEVLGIMDELICHEMSWHLGYPLSQTLLTSVYVEALSASNPHSEREAQFVKGEFNMANYHPMLRILRAYCMAMLKTCDFVIECIKSEHYYEEEDFVTNTYGRSFLKKVSTDDICKTLKEAVELALAQRFDIGPRVTDGFISRLELRLELLDAVQCYDHIEDPVLARKPWTKAYSMLRRIELSHDLGKPVDEAFSEKLQRKLASTLPPRPIVKLEFADAFGHLRRLIRDGSDVITVLEHSKSQNLQTFVSTFHERSPQPLVYIRTLLQTFLFTAMEVVDAMNIRSIIEDDLRTTLLPAHPLLDRENDHVEVVHDVRHFMAQQMANFRQRVAQVFFGMLRTACQNRCRVRRTLCHLIHDWDSLEMDAEDIDISLYGKTRAEVLLAPGSVKPAPIELYDASLASWCHMYKLRHMELIVQLGFELEITQPDEMAGMYWYLAYLARLRTKCVEDNKDSIYLQAEAQPLERGPLHNVLVLEQSFNYTRLALLESSSTWDLADALSCLYVVLERLGLVAAPAQPYDNKELRYMLRMKPFSGITCPVMPLFDDFKKDVAQADVSSEQLLLDGQDSAMNAKRGLETLAKLSDEQSFSVNCHDLWLASVKGVLKSAIATNVAISSVQKAIQSAKDGQVQIKAEVPPVAQAYHRWWRVPKITALR